MKREYAHLLNVAGNNADYYRSCEEHKAAVASAKVHAAQVEEAQASARQALWRERELEDMRVTAIRESEMSVDLSNLANVLGRWRTGCPTRRETIESSYAQTLDAHEREDRPIDFHALPFEGWVMFLPAFLDLKVGGSHPRYDFVRSNPPAGEFVFISHRGPADPVRWQPMLQGVAFLSHQLGSFIGAYGGGLVYDLLGSYNMAWKTGVTLGLIAGIAQLCSAWRRQDPPLAAAPA